MNKVIFAALIMMVSANSAFAIDLHSARSQGMVAEQANGYVKAVKSSPEVEALVADVNAKRKAEYERIAKEKGIKVEDVAVIAAQELLKK